MSDTDDRAAVVERVYQDQVVDAGEVTAWDLASMAPTCEHRACWNEYAGSDLP